MRLRYLVVPLLVLGAAIGLAAPGASAQGAPSPTSGTKLTGGLLSPRGMKIGPDSMIYVAEAGTGGTIAPPTAEGGKSGFTGRISKIDPATGARTTVVDKLPSNAGNEGDAVGVADVDFLNGQLYFVQTHGGAFYGFPSNPTGIYKVNPDATTTLIANIGDFNITNPIDDVKTGKQKDIEVGGNPYSMIVRDGNFFVADGNQNQIMEITPAGIITRISEFHGHPVLTGMASVPGGPLYVTTLGQFPFAPADGTVVRVGLPSGAQTKVASGFSSMTDVEVGPGGQLYALSFGDQSSDPNGPPWAFGTGKVFKLDLSTGTLTPLVTGFTFTTSIIFAGNTAYVANNGITIPGLNEGEIWQIPNFTSVQPLPAATATPAAQPTTAPPPAATATPRTGVTAPNTGTGPTGSDNTSAWLLAIAIGLIGVTVTGGAFALKRR